MNNVTASVLRPGLLVSLKTSIRGNVQYRKQVIEAAEIDVDGVERERWETERIVADAVELNAAKKARSKATSLIRGVCTFSAFGLLCPEIAADELDKAVGKAREIADEFNRSAKLSRVSVNVIVGRIAADDVEAVRAINSEIRDLLEDMENGIAKADVKSIREAAAKAKDIGNMLSPNAEARVKIAIDTARKAARDIVKAGETAAAEVDTLAINKIASMRTSFLDLDHAQEIARPAEIGRAVDFEPGDEIKSAAVSATSIELE